MNATQRQKLIDAALAVRQNAHAPYSHFQVGAALLTASGQVYAGCNVENASFGLTICAERTAIVSAVAHGQTKFLAMAVVAGEASAPCGACRQFLAEFCEDLPILLIDAQRPEQIEETSLAVLLPRQFRFPATDRDDDAGNVK